MDMLMEGRTIESLAEKIKGKILPELDLSIREMLRESVMEIVAETLKNEIKPIVDRLKFLTEENRALQFRVDQLETQMRGNNLVFHGVPESTYAEAASVAVKDGENRRPTPRQDTVKAVVECCRDKLNLDVSERDITAGYRIPGFRNAPRPIIVTFASRLVRDNVYESRRLLRKQTTTQGVYIKEHLTKKNSDIFSKGRKLLKEKRITSVWTRNGVVFVRKAESDRPTRVLSMEEVEKF